MSNDSARLLTDTVFAAYVSRQSSDGHMSGYVLLVGRDGAVSAVKTSGMDNAALVWDNQGLYFSDTSRDYLLTETGMRTWDSPKTDFQTAAYANPDGGWVSIYNLGFGAPGDEMGYVEQVVVTSANGAVRYDVPGFITATAQCGSQVFSLAEVVSPFTSLAQDMGAVIRDYPPFWPDMLTQVYPQPPTPSDALVSILQTSSGGTAFTSTCRDQQMLVIGAGSWVPPKPPVVTVWPIDGSTPSQRTIVGSNGEFLGLVSEVATFATVADWAPTPDSLVWFGGDGIVRSTNITTGRSVELWDSGSMRSAYTGVTFSGPLMYVLDPIGDWTADRLMRLRVHDLTSGVTKELLTTRLSFEAQDSKLVLRGLAVPPTVG